MSKLTELIGDKKKKKLRKDQWLILFLAGILLLVIALPTDCGGETEEQSQENGSASGSGQSDAGNSMADYEEELEQRLAQALSQMEGVGEVQVMITFQDNGETVVEKDTAYTSQEQTTEESDGGVTGNSQTESSETTVFYSDSGEEEPFVSKQILPSVEGVLVIAQGGGDQTVAANISEAVEALFGLEVHKIKIVEMNQVQEGSE